MRIKQTEHNKGHEVVDEYVYGPVNSRRYGQSLGVNLLPASKKICNFNCIYCQLGWDDSPRKFSKDQFPDKKLIMTEIQKKLTEIFQDPQKKLDHIVMSGNGEPTMHPDFYEISNFLVDFLKAQNKKIPISCFTNGTMLDDEKVVGALNRLNECCVKLDANLEKIDLPLKDFSLTRMIENLKNLKNLVIQSCFNEGTISNTDQKSIKDWLLWIKPTKPKRVDLYTISRNTPLKDLKPTSLAKLNEIADLLRDQGFNNIQTYTE